MDTVGVSLAVTEVDDETLDVKDCVGDGLGEMDNDTESVAETDLVGDGLGDRGVAVAEGEDEPVGEEAFPQ